MGAERLPFLKSNSMKITLNKIGEKLAFAYLILLGVWLVFAISLHLFFFYLDSTNQKDKEQEIVNKIDRKTDAAFRNNPNNIWYEKSKKQNK